MALNESKSDYRDTKIGPLTTGQLVLCGVLLFCAVATFIAGFDYHFIWFVSAALVIESAWLFHKSNTLVTY